MNDKKFLLSVSTSPDGEEISIHADSDGLSVLIKELEAIRNSLESDEAPHSHLMSESWGGDDLSESMLSSERDDGCHQVHHIKLYGWSREWRGKHGL